MENQILNHIKGHIGKKKKDKPFLIGINGIDGSGKSYFTLSLQKELQKTFNSVVVVSVDDFHNPKKIRYQEGKDSPDGFYKNSYNYEKLKKYVLNPIQEGKGKYATKVFDLEQDKDREILLLDVDNQTIFILEGIFLFRKELENYWDFKIFLDVSFETALNRNIQREKDQQSIGDKEQIINRYNMRYIPGQKMYFKNDNPRETSDIILDNNDYNKPILLKCNMNLKYTLEQAKESDKVFLLELRKTTMLSYLEKAGIILSEEEHIERVESFFDSSYIIENEDENSIGLLKYVEDKKSIELVQLQILPEYQSKGIGSTILKDLIAKSQKLDKQLTLKVLKNNPSKILYLRMGFKVVGEDDIEYHMEV